MMREFKISLKLLRYSYGTKTNIGMAVLFLVCGIVMTFIPEEYGSMWLSSYMITVVAMMPIQMHYSISASNMVAASPMRKILQTNAATMLNVFFFFAAYLITLLLKLVQSANHIRSTEDIKMELLLDAVLIIFIMVYTGIAYKLFFVATVTFVIAMIAVSGLAAVLQAYDETVPIPIWAAVLSGFAAIAVGGGLQYGFSLLLNKFPLSKSAQMAGLRKQL